MSDSGYRRPIPKQPPEELALFLDLATGLGVDFNRQPIKAELPGRRKKPRLVDLLDTARLRGVTRIILCGDSTPSNHDWLLPTQAQIAKGEEFTPGWRDVASYLGNPGTGRFKHIETGHNVSISTTRDWFGDTLLTPTQAQFGLETLRHVVGSAIGRPDWALMRTPSQTGLNVWKQRLDTIRNFVMEPIDPELGRLIQSTEPQHRNEIYTAGAGHCDCGDCIPFIDTDTIDGFYYADGRFMYHGVAKQSYGAAPAHSLTGEQAAALFARDHYHPARYLVRFTIPDFMPAHIGVFPVKKDTGERGWHWPNRPGYVGETWVNMVELKNAIDNAGYAVEFIEGIQLTKTNVVQPFAHSCQVMLDLLGQLHESRSIGAAGHDAVASAIKHMYRVTIGSFSRRQPTTTRFAARFEDISNQAIGGTERQTTNGGWTYQVPSAPKPDAEDTFHPEVAAMVWGNSRTRVLRFTQPDPKNNKSRLAYGALQLDPEHLIGIQGDAIYTTTLDPSWLPTHLGGIDDGKNGKLRIKGILPGPLETPHTLAQRQKLSNAAEANGWQDHL